MSYRKTFWFSGYRRHVGIEFAPWGHSPGIRIYSDGDEGQVGLWLSCGFFFSVVFSGFIRRSWYPTMRSCVSDSVLPCEREFSFSFHHWTLWWSLWATDDGLDSKKWPRWRKGSFNLGRFLFGRHRVSYDVLGSYHVEVLLPEASYMLGVTSKRRTDSWDRWFPKRRRCYEVVVDYAIPNNGPFLSERVDVHGIPVPGKGTEAYNQGDTFVSHWHIASVRSMEAAVDSIVSGIIDARTRYGGDDWRASVLSVVE